jgi:hypothetical protein
MKSAMGQQDETTRERLCSDLETLARCCQPEKTKATSWPSSELLQSLEDGIKLLVAEQRKKPLSWKTFQRLDKRMPRLRLALRVDNLVKRARDRFEEAGQPALSELKRQAERGDEGARNLLRDIAAVNDFQAAPKKIDWIQHEKVLAQFSRIRSVEPSYGRSAPLEVRCYARTLELLVDDYRREPLRTRSKPLLEWIARIGHPNAKNLLAFDYATERQIERKARGSQEEKALRQREKGRERTRKHRVWYRGKWVYPGDWLKFLNAGEFRRFYGKSCPLPTVCSGLEDSHCRDDLAGVLDKLSCGRKLSEQDDGFFFHRTSHVARCRDCQEAEWIADGYEVDFGWPSTFPGPSDTREERLAARKRYYDEARERDRRWLQTPEGQDWLRKAEARLKAIDSHKQSRTSTKTARLFAGRALHRAR